MPDAEFTPSTFMGGWLQPLTDAGRDLAQRVLGIETDEAPRWPEGHIVEPHEMRELDEWASVMGVAVVTL